MPLLLIPFVLVVHCTCRFHAELSYFTSLTFLALGVSSRACFLLHMDDILWKYSHDTLSLDVSMPRNYSISDTTVLAGLHSSQYEIVNILVDVLLTSPGILLSGVFSLAADWFWCNKVAMV